MQRLIIDITFGSIVEFIIAISITLIITTSISTSYVLKLKEYTIQLQNHRLKMDDEHVNKRWSEEA